jgi:hypothetical protein
MATYWVGRKNKASAPPRFEYLRNRPDFTAADELLPDGVTVATEDTVTTRWTWIESYVGGTPQWRNGNLPHDFGRNRAEKWAAMIDDAKVVRFGDDDAPAQGDALTEEQARRRAARQAYREALAAGTAEPL